MRSGPRRRGAGYGGPGSRWTSARRRPPCPRRRAHGRCPRGGGGGRRAARRGRRRRPGRALAAAGDPAQALVRLRRAAGGWSTSSGWTTSTGIDRLQRGALARRSCGRCRGGGGRAPRFFPELAFVGRDSELAQLRDVVAARGVAVVAGQAGAEVRLLAELARRSPLRSSPSARSCPNGRRHGAGPIAAARGARDRRRRRRALPRVPGAPWPSCSGAQGRAPARRGDLPRARAHGQAAPAGSGGRRRLPCSSRTTCSGPTTAASRCSGRRSPACPAGGGLAQRPDELAPGALTALPSVVEVGSDRCPDGRSAPGRRWPLARAVVAGTDGIPFAVAECCASWSAATRSSRARWLDAPRRARRRLAQELGRDGQRRAVLRRTARETGLLRTSSRSWRCWPGRRRRARWPAPARRTAGPSSRRCPGWPRPGSCGSASTAGRPRTISSPKRSRRHCRPATGAGCTACSAGSAG